MEDLLRHRSLRLLMHKGKLYPERVKVLPGWPRLFPPQFYRMALLLGWRHNGFNLAPRCG